MPAVTCGALCWLEVGENHMDSSHLEQFLTQVVIDTAVVNEQFAFSELFSVYDKTNARVEALFFTFGIFQDTGISFKLTIFFRIGQNTLWNPNAKTAASYSLCMCLVSSVSASTAVYSESSFQTALNSSNQFHCGNQANLGNSIDSHNRINVSLL